jgi:transcriptional regulator with XRE-family HTH domain
MTELGKRLRKIRKEERKLTQKQLEDLSGIPQNTISRIELGVIQEISSGTLIQLARALRVTTDYLLGLTPDEEEEDTPAAVGAE